MTFTQSVRTCFQKFVTFEGRASRSEFWYFVLFQIAGSVVLGILDAILFGWATDDPEVLNGLFGLIVLLPSISVAVRRLHDTDRVGWWWWLCLIPIIGWIILIIFYASVGTNGRNRFGENPLNGGYETSSIPRVERDD